MNSRHRRVVIIDDHHLFRQGIRALLDGFVLVVGEGGTSEDAERLVFDLQPDVLLLDVEIPGGTAAQTITHVLRHNPQTAIVVLTMHTDGVLKRQLIRAGAADFVAKTISAQDLVKVVTSAASRPPGAAFPGAPDSPRDILTERELEVLRMIAQAYTNREISNQLHIVEGTVKRHTANMYVKLGATSRIDAVRKALRLGLLG